MAGVFITFEGIEGCGKTTQIRLLRDYLKARGLDVILTREPGGTEIGECIRTVLLDTAHAGMSPLTELLLYAAARNQHVREVIRPALEAGKVVLCDRYVDATTAYQGAARRIKPQMIEELHKIAAEGVWPDLTILLDLSPEEGLKRAVERNFCEKVAGSQDRFEREDMSFHKRVREGYLSIAKAEPKRVVVVDAGRSMDVIQNDIIERVKRILKREDVLNSKH